MQHPCGASLKSGASAGCSSIFARHAYPPRKSRNLPEIALKGSAMAKSTAPPSPFAPERLPDMPQVPGVRFAACAAGIRYANRTDLMLAVLETGTTVAGVLTRSKTSSAPVLWCRESLGKGKARALVVNSGNANAFTGRKGAEATRMTAEAAAAAVGCAPDEV